MLEPVPIEPYNVLPTHNWPSGQPQMAMKRIPVGVCAALLLGATTPRPRLAQSGGPYGITSSTIDGGGATFSAGGTTQVGGTIGQPDAVYGPSEVSA